MQAEHDRISPSAAADRTGLRVMEAPLGLPGADLLVLLSPLAVYRFSYKVLSVNLRRLNYTCKSRT